MIFEIILILILAFISFVCSLFLIFMIVHMFFWIKSGTPFLASYKEIMEKIDKEIDWSGVKTFYDLGSGNGDVIKFLAARHRDVKFFGYEINPLRVWKSKFACRKFDNTKFESCDFFKKNFNQADLVFTFLLPKAMDKLLPKLKKEMKSNSTLVSNTFHFSDKDFKPEKIIDAEKYKDFKALYIFKF